LNALRPEIQAEIGGEIEFDSIVCGFGSRLRFEQREEAVEVRLRRSDVVGRRDQKIDTSGEDRRECFQAIASRAMA